MSSEENPSASDPNSDATDPHPLPATGFQDEALPSTDDGEEPAYTPPTNEEIASASPVVNGFIPIATLSRDDLQKLYRERVALLGEEKFLLQIAVPGSYDNLLWFQLQNFSAEAEREQAALAAVEDRSGFDYRLMKDGKPILSPTSFRAQKTTEPKLVSGDAGMLAMLSTRTGQIRRIQLYNSGFTIDLRNPNSDDMSTMIRRCRADLDEYGREFGSHFYGYADLILKRNFFDTLLNLIIGATLKDWKKSGVLLRRLKLPDYDVILTHLAALMYPDGYPDFRLLCTRPEDETYPTGCRHVTTTTANLTQLILTNFPALSDKAVAHMVRTRVSPDPVSHKDVDAYQAELGFEGQTIDFDGIRFTMTVPSFYDYFLAGEAFNADLLNEISADNRKGIYDAIAFREGRLFLPWIKQVVTLNEDGSPGLATEDKAVISFLIDTLSTKDPEHKLIEAFTDYVGRTKLSHVCFKTFPCEKCGYEPKTPSGFMTVDPQHNFFILLTQKLIRSRL